MKRTFVYMILSIAFCFITVHAQIDFNLNLKEAIDLPGNDIASLIIEDINNDNFPDYCYQGGDYFYAVSGLDQSVLLAIPRETSLGAIRPGDLNNDGLTDIALVGSNQIKLYLAPNYNEDYTISIPDSYGSWRQSVSELYFNRINDLSLIYVGISLNYSYLNSDPYVYGYNKSGRVLIYQFYDGLIIFLTDHDTDGIVKEIKAFSNGDAEAIIIRTLGGSYHEEIPGPLYDFQWADIFSLSSPFDLITIWSVGLRWGFSIGEIGKLFIGRPDDSDDDYLYFHSYYDTEDDLVLACIDSANGNVLWQSELSRNSMDIIKHLAMTGLLSNDYKDFIVFSDSCKVRNPYTGHLDNRGVISGSSGYFRCVMDQENDGLDEFFYYDADSVYVFNIESLTSVNDDCSLASRAALSAQNYPNPFNSSTLIKYELPLQSQVKIEIYDILGRKVRTLEDGLLPAGYHQVLWDAEGLSSGVYFYKLQAGEHIETKKMMLVK